ncbi:hypothetical protein HPULCUR_003100 [Helicostylum pulchrum]|uniref:Uncharacterized protein n=1 Tax=Helicostylum pulchrum TaxID=562976 RepID=A0ABP9XU01_9FUNG
MVKSARKALQVKKDLRLEIDVLKAKVRSAYTLEAQVNLAEYQPTSEEEELIKERAFNMRLLEKLESIYYTDKDHKRGEMVGNVYKENMLLLHFFYLVRLAQQGFFYTISAAYPDLEPEALIYLCDKLITASLYAERLPDPLEKKAYRTTTYELMRNLVEEKDIPIAEGFKTTYKQVMSITQDLIYRSIKPSEEEVVGGDETSQSVKPLPTNIPPVWVVMPYNGLMDNRTFALPGAVPSLPFPTHMLPALNTPAVVFPNAFEDLKKDIAKKEKSIKKWRKVHEHKDVNDESKVGDSKENEVKVEENEATEKVTQNSQDEEEHDEDEDEYEYDEDYERDRFADADITDSEDKENNVINGRTGQESEEVAKQDTIKNDVALEKPIPTPTPTPVVASQNIDKPKSEESDKAISSWITFAASSPLSDTSKDRT